MSVELEKRIIKTQTVLTTSATQAVMDNDIIVPDTQPDVRTILRAEIMPMICDKHVQRDYIIITGNLDYSILYMSEEKDSPSRVKTINVRLPFTHQIEAAGAQDAAFAGVKADVITVEFTPVNSRKINVKSVVDFECNIIRPDAFEAVCSAVSESPMPSREREITSFALVDYAENEFEASDVLAVPSGSEMIDELLKVDVRVAHREIKSINSKLVAKGAVVVSALYTDTAGDMQCMSGEMPFTEILSIDNVGVNDICEVEYAVTDMNYSVAADSDGDATLMEIAVRVNAATCVYENHTERITEDLYSPDFDVSTVNESAEITRMMHHNTENLAIKDTVDIPAGSPPVTRIYNISVKPYVESAEIRGGKAHISGVADTYVNYMSSDAECPVCCHKKEVPFSYTVSAPCGEDAQVNVLCDVESVSWSAISPYSAEVRFSLDVDTKILMPENVTYISNVEADESLTAELADAPGIVIYFAEKGESMWDISKRYRTTAEAIASANGCEYPEILNKPERIMIPRRK